MLNFITRREHIIQYQRGQASRYNSGQAVLAIVVIALFAGLAIMFGISALALSEKVKVRTDIESKRSYYLAEASTEDLMYRILNGRLYSANETLSLDGYMATATVVDVGTNEKDITTSGDVSSSIRTVNARVKTGQGVSFNYGLQIGYLGLQMSNTATVYGSVYSNGSIDGNNNAKISGDVWVAGGVGATPNVSQASEQAGHYLKFSDADGHQDVAQKFIPTVTAEPRQITVYLKKINNPSSNISVRIVPDNGGKPNYTNAVGSGSINRTTVSTTQYAAESVALSSTDYMLAGQTYWLVLDTSSFNSSNYFELAGADLASYSSGDFRYTTNWTNSSAVWVQPGSPPGPGNMKFDIYMGENTTFVKDMTVGTSSIVSVHAYKIDNTTVNGFASSTIIQDSTITKKANCTTLTSSSIQGSSPLNTCLTPASQSPPALSPPLTVAQIDAFRDGADAGGTCGLAQGCTYNSGTGLWDLDLDGQATATLGPLKITGDLKLDNHAGMIMTGDLHVMGKATLKNYCTAKLDPATYPSGRSGAIIVEGNIALNNQCTFLGNNSDPNNPNSFIVLVSRSTSISGPAAVDLDNRVNGGVLYAENGGLNISNTGVLNSGFAQKIILQNSASIKYKTGLANVSFSTGPSGGWQITKNSWQEVQ